MARILTLATAAALPLLFAVPAALLPFAFLLWCVASVGVLRIHATH